MSLFANTGQADRSVWFIQARDWIFLGEDRGKELFRWLVLPLFVDKIDMILGG